LGVADKIQLHNDSLSFKTGAQVANWSGRFIQRVLAEHESPLQKRNEGCQPVRVHLYAAIIPPAARYPGRLSLTLLRGVGMLVTDWGTERRMQMECL
jgi:hypothetical protein